MNVPKSIRKQVDAIVASYQRNEHDYAQALEVVEAALTRVRKGAPEIVHSVACRRKDADHLRDKLFRRWKKRGKLDVTEGNLDDKINDLVAGRLIHLHTFQVERLKPILEKTLLGSGFRPLGTRLPVAKVWDPEYQKFFRDLGYRCELYASFYSSVHYEYRLPGRNPTRTCEIQVRTLAEELWGEVDHAINYPHKTSIRACGEQIKALARATGACNRLVDSIFDTAFAKKSDKGTSDSS